MMVDLSFALLCEEGCSGLCDCRGNKKEFSIQNTNNRDISGVPRELRVGVADQTLFNFVTCEAEHLASIMLSVGLLLHLS